ncbi:MAG: GTP-binding protein [Bacteroidota bacterium]
MKSENNPILLKPRFRLFFKESQEDILQKFRKNLNKENCKYCSKIVDHHVIIDVPKDEERFWSPQMHLEIEKENETGKTMVRGLFGPKPKIWTLFMFFHFVIAIAFVIFLVIAYSNYSLNQDYKFALNMCLLMPALSLALYLVGQIGKRISKNQMEELSKFFERTLE